MELADGRTGAEMRLKLAPVESLPIVTKQRRRPSVTTGTAFCDRIANQRRGAGAARAGHRVVALEHGSAASHRSRLGLSVMTDFEKLDDEIAKEEEKRASDAGRRADLIKEVQGLQLALEQINAKMSTTKQENSELATENQALSTYIDSLMENITAMGSKIVADKGAGSSPLSKLFTRRRSTTGRG